MNRVMITIYGATLLVASSCGGGTKHVSSPPPALVEVAEAQSKMLYDRIDVASHTMSLHSATIQPRVSGFLRSINFDEGMPVRRGDLLFEIDPREYNIEYAAAQAALEKAEAEEALAQSNYLRALPLVAIDAISQSDMDQYTATHKASRAAVRSATESLNNAKLNLSYTKIYAPISGLAAATTASVGDYVGLDTQNSSLTTISYVDTIEVEIPISTSVFLRNLPQESSATYANSTLLSDIALYLSSGERYPHQGIYSYTLKNSPAESSTIVIVAKFPNPEITLKAGMFARIRANIGERKARVVVPQEAVSQTQGINSVWVISTDSIAQLRNVSLGETYDSEWIITEGVEAGESVITSGQLKVHNGAKVIPTKR